jgi:hypothetical protein
LLFALIDVRHFQIAEIPGESSVQISMMRTNGNENSDLQVEKPPGRHVKRAPA